MEIIEPKTATELDGVRQLLREFVEWHRLTHADDIDLIDRYFDQEAFEHELADLPGDYGPPGGKLLLAKMDGEPAGCVALHDLGNGECEMKRMFVPERYRGRGLGLGLGTAIVGAGKRLGYRRMRLDTSHRQEAAMGLYTRLGFKRTPPYYELSPELRSWLVFFAYEYHVPTADDN